jgi:hypothetical protein
VRVRVINSNICNRYLLCVFDGEDKNLQLFFLNSVLSNLSFRWFQLVVNRKQR